MKATIAATVAGFGARAKAKLANPGASGEPEDQLRAPFEQLLADLAELANFPKTAVVAVGESSVSDLKTRPDYAFPRRVSASPSPPPQPPLPKPSRLAAPSSGCTPLASA